MDQIQHNPEFLEPDETDPAPRSMAKCYARVFGTPDGQRVLADLVAKFPPDKPRFPNAVEKAAWIDGQSTVVREILLTVKGAQPTN
jgi:hypothetical protein